MAQKKVNIGSRLQVFPYETFAALYHYTGRGGEGFNKINSLRRFEGNIEEFVNLMVRCGYQDDVEEN